MRWLKNNRRFFMKNGLMVILAVIAIAGVLAFVTSYGSYSGDDIVLHTHSYTVTKAATCTASGTETCSCGETLTIPATGHSYTHGICDYCGHDNGIGGCITCGDSSVVTSCSICGKALGRYCMDHQPYGSYCSAECAG